MQIALRIIPHHLSSYATTIVVFYMERKTTSSETLQCPDKIENPVARDCTSMYKIELCS